jgi:hypothetical protein
MQHDKKEKCKYFMEAALRLIKDSKAAIVISIDPNGSEDSLIKSAVSSLGILDSINILKLILSDWEKQVQDMEIIKYDA